jgi:hypothetical protein
MAKLGTFCKNCCFYNKEQQNCMHGLIDIFRDRNAEIVEEEGCHVIDRVCQYRRNHEWNEDKNLDEKLQICKEEVYIQGSIIVIANDIDNLKKTIEKLDSLENIEKFNLIIIHKGIFFSDIVKIEMKSKYVLVSMKNNDINMQIYRVLKHAQNGYLFIIDSNQHIDHNIIDKVNNMVNKKLYRLLHVSPIGENLHQSVSMTSIYKWLKSDLEYTFAEKLKTISEEENTDPQVFTWKDINEQYTD